MRSDARRRLVETVSAIVPVVHCAWPVGGAPELPWAVYTDEPAGFGADMETYTIRHTWTVELYERQSDSDLEQRVFDALAGAYGYVEPPQGTWIDSEGCYMCYFRFGEIERI